VKKNFLGVFGHTTMDHIIDVPRFPEPNTSIEVVGHKTYHGGTGANIAFIAASVGVPVSLSSFVGEDFPDSYEKALRKAGVDTYDLERMEGYTTPTCWIMTNPDQEQVAIINQGPMRDAALFPVAKHSVDSVKYVHICTGRPEYYIEVVEYAKEKGKLVGFDPGQELHYVYTPAIFKKILKLSDIFFANASESKRALQYLGLKDMKKLLDYVDTLVLTKGSKGSEIVTRDGKIAIPKIPGRKFIDPTGAGDGYRAGFYAGLYKGLDLRECGLAGSSVASFVVEAKGCQTNAPTWARVLERMEKFR
jgi:sugar/nucleoside kinase (ribokinase family)